MISPRGPMATRRMTAHWVVLAAAALTTLVAAAVAATLAVFAGQALPLAVQHDLVTAPDTTLSMNALVSGPSQAAQGSATLRAQIAAAMPGIPFSLQEAFWSSPLGLVPGALPATPTNAGKGNTALLQAASMKGIASHAVLVAGRWPATSGGTRPGAIPAALPVSAAALLHVSAGDVLRLRDQGTNALVSFDITGVFTRRQGSGAANSYWNLSYIPASGMSTESGSTTYGPLIVSQAAFGTALTMSSGSWVGQPDMTAFSDSDLNPVAANLTSLSKSLPTASFLNGAQLTTSLPSVLSGADSDLVVARSVLVISALQLLVLAIAALLAVARLLAAQREGESALLVARGATRSQLTRLTAAEVVPLSALVSIAGAVAGIWLASALASAGPLGTAGIQLAGRPGSWSDATAAALVVAVIAVAALLAPGATPSPTAARVRRGRQAMVAGVARAGLDIALVVLAVLAGWQLRQYSAASNGGTAGIDPVLALAPALALAAGSVAALRLLPLAARTTDRLAARGKGLVTSLAGWQFSRMPIRQGSAALLLIMAVAAGTLALAQHESWTRSASDQAIFATGGDVQVNLPAQLEPGDVGAVTDARGVTHSLAVAADIQASPGEMVAVDSAQAPQAARLRGDESRLPAASLFRAITPSGGLPGAVLPALQPGARAGTIRLTAALGLHLPVSIRDSRALAAQLGPVTVTLTILDATGSAYQVAAGTLVADGLPHLLVGSLGGNQARYPLRVAAITATYLMPLRAAPSLALTVSGLPLAGWTGDASSPALDDYQASQGLPLPIAPPGRVSAHVTSRAATFTFSSGYGQETTGGVPTPPATAIPAQLVLLPAAARVTTIPAIATGAFMDANGAVIGSVVPVSIEGEEVSLRVVAEVTSFPTVTAPGGALITDLGSVQEYLARQSAPPLPVTQWWLATADGSVPPALTASVPAGTGVTSAAGLATAVTSDPLSAAPQLALLAMAAAAALLAITGFWVSIAADVRQRRTEAALLAALGVTRRGAALQLFLEKLLLSLPSSALGVLLGLLVARLIVPAVTLTPTAQQPTPPAVTQYDLPQAIALALAVAVLPAVVAVLAATRRPDAAAELRAAESA
ncbi:FtsX-like permease family protein [Trebonia sp.]|uniref:FtsX-like permease family protein n=1 Tax=Trebonia sp. TaxID=2767075 RepID=UPI003BB03D6E